VDVGVVVSWRSSLGPSFIELQLSLGPREVRTQWQAQKIYRAYLAILRLLTCAEKETALELELTTRALQQLIYPGMPFHRLLHAPDMESTSLMGAAAVYPSCWLAIPREVYFIH
jgi:hypothetical protein